MGVLAHARTIDLSGNFWRMCLGSWQRIPPQQKTPKNCPPGSQGSPNICILRWNPFIIVSKKPMQNFTTQDNFFWGISYRIKERTSWGWAVPSSGELGLAKLDLHSLKLYLKLRSSSIYRTIEVVFHYPKYWGRLPIFQKNEVVFNVAKNLTSSSIF